MNDFASDTLTVGEGRAVGAGAAAELTGAADAAAADDGAFESQPVVSSATMAVSAIKIDIGRCNRGNIRVTSRSNSTKSAIATELDCAAAHTQQV